MLGIAFAGGGIAGAAELGITEALYEKGIKPDIITGTSAGAIVSGLLAVGYSPSDAFDHMKKINSHILDVAYGEILDVISWKESFEYVVKGDRLEKLLEKLYYGKLLNQIDTPIAVVSTDILTSTEVIFSSHAAQDLSQITDSRYDWITSDEMKLSRAVRASCSLPAFFKPVTFKNYTLVDGGLVNNVPCDIARAIGADKVITLDVGYNGETVSVSNIYQMLNMTINIYMERVTDQNADKFGVYLNPKITGVSILDFYKMEECFEQGYTYGKSVVDSVLKQL